MQTTITATPAYRKIQLHHQIPTNLRVLRKSKWKESLRGLRSSLDKRHFSSDTRSLIVEAPSSKRTSSTHSSPGRETYDFPPVEPGTGTACFEKGIGSERAGRRGSRDGEIAHLGAQFLASSTSSSGDAYHVEREVIEEDGDEWQSHRKEDKNASSCTVSSASYK